LGSGIGKKYWVETVKIGNIERNGRGNEFERGGF